MMQEKEEKESIYTESDESDNKQSIYSESDESDNSKKKNTYIQKKIIKNI